jgi:uncharacterized membrane protein
MTLRLIFNILAVCGAGVFTGALMNIGLSFGPYWQSLPPAEFLDWFSKNAHFIGRTITLSLAPALVGLVASLWLSWSDTGQRILWGAALLCIIGLLVITAIYHLPTNSQFAAKSVSPEQVPAALNTWLVLHTVRIALALIASVLGIVAVSR